MLSAVLTLSWIICPPVQALDEDSEVFGFIPVDAGVVVALDVDELMAYGRSVGGEWRDADQAHFFDALGILSTVAAREAGKPDIMWFFENVDGVMALTIEPGKDFPLLAFQAARSGDGELLERYTLAYIAEIRYQKFITEIKSALSSYYYRSYEDPDNPDELIYPNDYPESLHDLVEDGYLDAIPTNPYTGELMEVMDNTADPSLGDITYIPRYTGGCCPSDEPEEDKEDMPDSYKLIAFRIGGVQTYETWSSDYEPYDNFEWQLRSKLDDVNAEGLGFTVETDGDWTMYGREDGRYAFVASDDYIVFGPSADQLHDSVTSFEAGEGYHFAPPEDFDTEGAFYRNQTNFEGMDMPMGFPADMCGDIPPEAGAMIFGIFSQLGWEAFESDHNAVWLEDGDIRSLSRTVLTGEARRTPIGSLVYAEPEILLTAVDGPFTLIGEIAWANPGEYVQAVMDLLMETIMPIVGAEMGDEANPAEILGMLGLNEFDPGMIDQVYILFTESTEREDGSYIPGLTNVIRTDNPDLAYTVVGLVDTMSFMVPGFPFQSADFEDENARTWFIDHPGCPISPTIAWTDGWMVKSLFREDALAAIEALDAGEFFTSNGLGPANIRTQVNRQQLVRGLADIAYVIPEDGVPAVGVLLELAAQLSEPDERLEATVTNHGDYYVKESRFSIGLFEDLVPVFVYVIKAIGESDKL